MPAMEYSEPPSPQLETDVEDEMEASPLSGLLEQQQEPTGGQGIIKVDELADGSLVVEPSDDQELFDDFLGRVNDISEATGASDFESEVIPLLQREIPGLRVYEIEDDEGDDGEEPSLDDFRDVEDYAKAVSDLMETEHEENQIQEQQRRRSGRLEKRGQQQANIIMPNNLFFDY